MKTPTVYVDGTVFENQSQLGIWRIFFESLSRTSNEIDYRLLLAKKPVQRIPSGVAVAKANHRIDYKRLGRFRRTVTCKWDRLSHNIPNDAIWHSTFFSLDPYLDRRNCVTIYDMTAELWYGVLGAQAEPQVELKRRAIEQADRAICISQSTADDFLRFYPSLKGQTTVIPLGADHLQSNQPIRDARRESYALFVGGRDYYKNFRVVLDAMTSGEWPRGFKLLVAGKPFSKTEQRHQEILGIRDLVEHRGFVTDTKLRDLYQNASCFLFPSLYEGFGIPVLESQSAGCPAILSDIPVFREIAADSAYFFNPLDARSLAQACGEMLNPSTQKRFIEKGYANTLRFRWDDASSKLANVYKQLWEKTEWPAT